MEECGLDVLFGGGGDFVLAGEGGGSWMGAGGGDGWGVAF